MSKTNETNNAHLQELQHRHSKRVNDFQTKNFGERYAGVSLSSLLTGEFEQNKISQFLKKKSGFLVYCGSPGIGKTFLCAALIDWAMRNFDSIRYHKDYDLYNKLRNFMDGDIKGDYLVELNRLIDDDFLMVDDVGSAGITDWRKDIFFNVIDYRYNSNLPTVITRNFSAKEIKEIYHPRVSSRLFNKDSVIIEIMDGEDLRQ